MHEQRNETVRNCRGLPQPESRKQTGARVSGDLRVSPARLTWLRRSPGPLDGNRTGAQASRGWEGPDGLWDSTTGAAGHAQPTNDPPGSHGERDGSPWRLVPGCGAPRRAAPQGWRAKTAGTRQGSLDTNTSQGLALHNLGSGFHQRGSDIRLPRANPRLGWFSPAVDGCCITICLFWRGTPPQSRHEHHFAGRDR